MNLDETTSRIKKWLRGEKAYPMKVDFFITEKCNLRCAFCNYPHVPKERLKKELTEKELMRIVDWCGQHEVKIMGILGGEPFVRKVVLLKLMERIKSYGIEGSLVTNGTLLDEKSIRKIVEMKWDLIRFSIDGDEKTHDILRGVKGCYAIAKRNLMEFKRIKESLDSNYPTIEINFVLCNANFEKARNVVELASEANVNFIYFLPVIELTKRAKELKIKKDEWRIVKEELKDVDKLAKKLGIKTNLNEILVEKIPTKNIKEIIAEWARKGRIFIPCFLPWYTMSIDAIGNVTPCCNLQSIGENVRNKSLDEIWFGEAFNSIRKTMLSGKLFEECSRCCLPLMDENNLLREMISR